MPVTTPKQKIERVKIFGGEYVEIILIGDNFDDAQYEAQKQNTDKDLFVHAFDDVNVIEGQGTIGLEILDQVDKHFDYLIVPVGGGGLISGIITVFKELSPKTKIIGVEAEGAPATVSYTHLRAHETEADLVCRLLLEKKNIPDEQPLVE